MRCLATGGLHSGSLSCHFFPQVKFLTLAAALFAYVEVFAHLILFNISMKSFYKAGLLTALFGLMPISLHYFFTVGFPFSGLDVVLAIIWIVPHYYIGFRGRLY
jgi:hypothetical protein